MLLMKLVILVITLHLAMGFTQMVVSYYAGDVADYGAAGFISHTPIGSFFDIESEQTPQTSEGSWANLRGMFDVANDAGDAINGLATFDYGFLDMIEPDDGLPYMVVMGLRIVSVLLVLGTAFALLYLLFDSNLLTSKLGLALVGFGAGLGGLSALGALVGE